MKRAVGILGLAMSCAAAGLFFSDAHAWGLVLLAAAYANLKIMQRVWP